jgi:hypothetical protein
MKLSLSLFVICAVLTASHATARSITAVSSPAQPRLTEFSAEQAPAQKFIAPPSKLLVPTPSGDCRLKLVPHTRGRLAHCAATGVTFSGPLLACEHLAAAHESTCVAATTTTPNLARARKPAAPVAEQKSK